MTDFRLLVSYIPVLIKASAQLNPEPQVYESESNKRIPFIPEKAHLVRNWEIPGLCRRYTLLIDTRLQVDTRRTGSSGVR